MLIDYYSTYSYICLTKLIINSDIKIIITVDVVSFKYFSNETIKIFNKKFFYKNKVFTKVAILSPSNKWNFPPTS